MYICIFFGHFPVAGNKRRKKINAKRQKKKKGAENLVGLLPNKNCIVT